MKKYIFIVSVFITVLLLMLSCKEEIPMKEFNIRLTGFHLENQGSFTQEKEGEFEHRMAGGSVYFYSEDRNYYFRTGRSGMEDYTFVLPHGTYQMEFKVSEASMYGQEGASYLSDPVEVSINDSTDTVRVEVIANCALVLVEDPDSHLEYGAYMIERHSFAEGYFSSKPMSKDETTGAWYTYFTPDTVPTNPTAFLWFYDRRPGGEKGGYSTLDMQKGHCYIFTILE